MLIICQINVDFVELFDNETLVLNLLKINLTIF